MVASIVVFGQEVAGVDGPDPHLNLFGPGSGARNALPSAERRRTSRGLPTGVRYKPTLGTRSGLSPSELLGAPISRIRRNVQARLGALTLTKLRNREVSN